MGFNKWELKTIRALERKGYDTYTAGKLYDRALKRTKNAISQGFNAEFQAYASLTFDEHFIKFNIKSDRLYIVKSGLDVSNENFEKAYTEDRLEKIASKSPEIKEKLDEYLNDMITLQDLNDFIEQHKASLKNSDYIKAGS